MKQRYRLFLRWKSVFYAFDNVTKTFESLGTKDRDEAQRLVIAKNEALKQPAMNLGLARVYLRHSDPLVAKRTWQHAMDEIVKTKRGPTQERWQRAIKQSAFDGIRAIPLIETQAEHFLGVLDKGTLSTNVHLRKLHNFCLDRNWLPWAVIPKRQWPPVHFKEKRSITLAEHRLIIDREKNAERRSFYELCWHLGGSQSDIANLNAEAIDWKQQTIGYARKKTGSLAIIHFGDEIAEILRRLPVSGPLLTYMKKVRAGDRATEFKQRCDGLGIRGVSLHSYRYAWAERARKCGYPERFAQEALGHNSKAVHRSYATRAEVRMPSLEQYERNAADETVIPIGPQAGTTRVSIIDSAQAS